MISDLGRPPVQAEGCQAVEMPTVGARAQFHGFCAGLVNSPPQHGANEVRHRAGSATIDSRTNSGSCRLCTQ